MEEEKQDKVFQESFIPRSLHQVDFEEVQMKQTQGEVSALTEAVAGMTVTPGMETRVQQEEEEEDDESSSSSSSLLDTEQQNLDEELHVGKKRDKPVITKEEKKANKAKVKAEKAEKRKTKIKKKDKKLHRVVASR